MNAKLGSTDEQGDKPCIYLGNVVINDVRADTFVCGMKVVARFGDDPDDFITEHLVKLSMTSNIFLLTAFRLYLDVRGVTSSQKVTQGAGLESFPLQS